MTEREMEAVLLHEEGEHRVGLRLGADWDRLLVDLIHTPAELMARAVRDHWADCLVTLDALIQHGEAASLHFYIGNLTAMRRELFPGLLAAYEDWHRDGDTQPLRRLARRGADHWETLAMAMLAIHRESPEAAAPRIQALVGASPL